MTEAEAKAILGPEVYAEIQARPTKPLTQAQITLLVALLAVDPDQAATTDAA